MPILNPSDTTKSLSILLAVTLFFTYGSRVGLTSGAPLTMRFVYLFHHAGIIHLIINVYALLSVSFLSRLHPWQFLASFLIAIMVPSCVLSGVPVVGISGALYAMAGMVLMQDNRWPNLLLANLPVLAIQFLIPGVACLLHLYCLIVGLSVGLVFSARYD